MEIKEILGSGIESVYAYHFPSDETDTIWPIKIGRTRGNPIDRIRNQQASMKETPVIGVVWRTANSFWLEKELHVSFCDRKLDTFGNEWYETNYDEIKRACQIQARTGDKIVRDPRQLGAALRRFRTQRQMTQSELKDDTGLRQGTLSNLEGGGASKLQTVMSVMAALDLEMIIRPRQKTEYHDGNPDSLPTGTFDPSSVLADYDPANKGR